jgi:hypothetical protein
MDWIKRNLYFVIFMVLALFLMGGSGWYLYSSWSLNAQKYAEFSETYSRLKTLNDQSPNPGEEGMGKVDNVAAAKEQEAELRKVMDRSLAYYERIKRIPDLPKVNDHDFSTALSLAIAQMQRAASNANVSLATEGYGFSFDAERQKMVFDQSGLNPLSVQLGEVKAVTEVLFNAKVNSLDGLRRERVSRDDTGADTDYLEQRSTTNSLAILTPYEVTFRGFSQELAAVLSGFASSPYGFVVKSITVEPAPASEEAPPPANTPSPMPVQNPVYVPQPPRPTPFQDPYESRRYNPGGPRPRPIAQPVVAVPIAPVPKAGALPTILTEKKLKVTILLVVVKPLAPAKTAPK